jgi:hypothetical protein
LVSYDWNTGTDTNLCLNSSVVRSQQTARIRTLPWQIRRDSSGLNSFNRRKINSKVNVYFVDTKNIKGWDKHLEHKNLRRHVPW